MHRFFDNELVAFRTQLSLMGKTAVRQIDDATAVLNTGDSSLAQRVIANDDEIDLLELRIDDEALRYMNLRTPIATDLRLVVAGMKIAQNLERVGDETVTISRQLLLLSTSLPPQIKQNLVEMLSIARQMLIDSIDTFLTPNPEAATGIITRDASVNKLHKQTWREILDLMRQSNANPDHLVSLLFISKSIERIGDHATNIAEITVFLSNARDIRHPSVPHP